MTNDMKLYYDYTLSPLGTLFYKTVFSQLEGIQNKAILDFGSGFGFTSNFLAQHNHVTAVEKDEIMIKHSFQDANYTQIHHDLSAIKAMESNQYDIVTCHLVLEFVDNPTEILTELVRVLKKGGLLSIVKHNTNGRIIQAIVQDFDLNEANNLLNGGFSFSSAFGDIKYYPNETLLEWTNHQLTLEQTFGVRALASLHNATIQSNDNWVNDMLTIEKSLCEHPDFIKIAYFNHLLLSKN